jgi:hypothetical protein
VNKQEIHKLIFDVLNRELIKSNRGSDTIAEALVNALMLAEEKPKRHTLIGFQIIGDMSREDLINECLAFHRKHCESVNTDELKAAVVTSRLMQYKESLMEEARMSPPTGFLGLFGSGSPVDTD